MTDHKKYLAVAGGTILGRFTQVYDAVAALREYYGAECDPSDPSNRPAGYHGLVGVLDFDTDCHGKAGVYTDSFEASK